MQQLLWCEANGNKCTVAHARIHTFDIAERAAEYALASVRVRMCERERIPNETSNQQHWCDLLFFPHKYMRRLNCTNNEMESSSVCCNRFASAARFPLSLSLSHTWNMHSPSTYLACRIMRYRQFPFIELKFGRRESCTHCTFTINASIDLLSILNIFAFCTRLLSHPFIHEHMTFCKSEQMK